MTELDFTAAVVVLAELRPGAEPEELPCTECREVCHVDDMVDCGDIAPLAGLCCATCEAKLLADLRDEMPSDGELRRREAAVRGGLRIAPGEWIDE
jgi:hypothetical protein